MTANHRNVAGMARSYKNMIAFHHHGWNYSHAG